MKELNTILKNIESKKYNNIYFLQGDEEYSLDLVVKKFETTVLKKNEKCFDEIVAYGKDIQMSTIVDYAKKSPMLAQKQLIIIKEAQEIVDISKDSGKNQFLHYIQNPNPRTILVLVYKNKTLDKRTSFGKIISKKTTFLTFKKPYENQVKDWIINFIYEQNLKITEKAASMIHEYYGNNLKGISNEIEKLKNNLKEKDILIDDVMIEKYIGINRNFNGFELQSALGSKDINKVFVILNYFQQNPKACPIVPMVSIIYAFFLKIMQIHSSKDKSKSYLSSLLKVNPYFVSDYIKASKNYDLNQCLHIINFLHEADLKSKGINSPYTLDFEIAKELVCKILIK